MYKYKTVAKFEACNMDYSKRFMENVSTYYIWETPYKTKEEAEAAAELIRTRGRTLGVEVVKI